MKLGEIVVESIEPTPLVRAKLRLNREHGRRAQRGIDLHSPNVRTYTRTGTRSRIRGYTNHRTGEYDR